DRRFSPSMEDQDHEYSKNDGEVRKSLLLQEKPCFTVHEAIESAGFSRFQYILCAIGGLSWLASATEIMLLAILSPSLKCEWQLTSVQQALCSTSVFLGWMVSSPIWGRVCDIHGRRKGLMAASLVGVVFGILTSFAPSFYLFLVARFGVGFSVGGMAQSVTVTAEFLPVASKARWLIILKSFFAIGTAILTALAIVILPNLGWRWLVAYAALPMAAFGICCWWLPESVRFDVSQGNIVAARATLDRIARFNGKSLPPGELEVETEESSSDMSDLLKPSHRRTTLQLWIIWTLCGLLYYGLAIYTSLLLHSPLDQCSSASSLGEISSKVKREVECRQLTTENYIDIIVTTMSEVPGLLLTMYAVDLIGRKASFAAGFAIFSTSCALLVMCLPRFVIVASMFVGRSAIAVVFQIAYIYSTEVYPTSLRAQGLGTASGWGRFGSMITPVITEMLFAHDLIFPPIVFIVGGGVGAILSILLPIETSEKARKVRFYVERWQQLVSGGAQRRNRLVLCYSIAF
ncbi:hypothetical protein PMAYCL1PPCAC_15072, partial [Pristionchus mayeri]